MGIHWETLRKIQDHPEPPGYRMDFPRSKPKLGPYLEVIAQIIKDDKSVPKKQAAHCHADIPLSQKDGL